jgi:hypothetical protein
MSIDRVGAAATHLTDLNDKLTEGQRVTTSFNTVYSSDCEHRQGYRDRIYAISLPATVGSTDPNRLRRGLSRNHADELQYATRRDHKKTCIVRSALHRHRIAGMQLAQRCFNSETKKVRRNLRVKSVIFI